MCSCASIDTWASGIQSVRSGLGSLRSPIGWHPHIGGAPATAPVHVAQPVPRLVAASRPPISTAPSGAEPTVNVEALPLVSSFGQRRTPTPAPEPPRGEPPLTEASLHEQQALLDQARLALGQGQAARCLDALAAHRGRFPQSLLAEKRDVLTIKAMAKAGNLTSAREQAARFIKRYPRSLLIPSIESTVGVNR
jgi:hypothetical protein